jgi:ABC-2 type transport system ATP-binding protein
VIVQAQGLAKSFGSKLAVDDLSFTLKPGSVTGFLGPNGSGKSTTLRLMMGLDHGVGQTLFDGKPLNKYKEVTKVVGTHLDAKLFHPNRTAYDHLKMLASESGTSKKRVDEVLELMGLQDVAKKRPKGFSLGMAQRLGLAGAVLAEPQVLFLDEPANGLDPATIHWLRDFIKKYAEQDRTVLVSSHLLSEMELMADDLIVIAKGKLIANESMETFIKKNSGSRIIVRVDKTESLLKVLQAKGFSANQDGTTIQVSSDDTDTIGHIAFENGIRVLELSENRDSLETTFLRLTEDGQEYETGGHK